jgi:hypothetical protein
MTKKLRFRSEPFACGSRPAAKGKGRSRIKTDHKKMGEMK